MNQLLVMRGFGGGFYRLALSEGTTASALHDLLHAFVQSDQTVVRRAQIFVTKPVPGISGFDAPLEFGFHDGTWELSYQMNTEYNEPSDFEVLASVNIEDVVRAAWGASPGLEVLLASGDGDSDASR